MSIDSAQKTTPGGDPELNYAAAHAAVRHHQRDGRHRQAHGPHVDRGRRRGGLDQGVRLRPGVGLAGFALGSADIRLDAVGRCRDWAIFAGECMPLCAPVSSLDPASGRKLGRDEGQVNSQVLRCAAV